MYHGFYLKPKHMATPVVMAIGKETSNPLTFNDSPLTGVYTPGSDENRLKLKDMMYILSYVAEKTSC